MEEALVAAGDERSATWVEREVGEASVALSRWRGVAAGGFILALGLGAGSSSVLSSKAIANVSRSTLTIVAGPVLLGHGAAEFTSAEKGDVLADGDMIRTAPGATAEITSVDGSSVRVEPATEFVVTHLGAEADGGTVVGMMRMLGDMRDVITKLISGGSRYDVRAPSSTASVRG
jgi:hypothetical protein